MLGGGEGDVSARRTDDISGVPVDAEGGCGCGCYRREVSAGGTDVDLSSDEPYNVFVHLFRRIGY